MWGKDDGSYDSLTIWDSGLYKKIKEAKEAQIKKEAKEAHKKKEKIKKERKREKGQCYYPFTTLVLQSSTMFFI